MKRIKIYEVGPRDGFQSVEEYIPLPTKQNIVRQLVDSGIKQIQVTSFVNPKSVPQMCDAKQLAESCLAEHPEVNFSALVPNLKGAQAAYETGIRQVSYVVSLSEKHNLANINRTHQESFDELAKIQQALPDLSICLDLATAFGCPFEGKKSVEQMLDFLAFYIDQGIQKINLCDTIGIANPNQIRNAVNKMACQHPKIETLIHIHDTRNMGMVNTLAAIECGVQTVQSSLGGLGGCPFSPGATGNLATEDLVFMLEAMGYETGIDVACLVHAAKNQFRQIPYGTYSGHLQNVERINGMCGLQCY